MGGGGPEASTQTVLVLLDLNPLPLPPRYGREIFEVLKTDIARVIAEIFFVALSTMVTEIEPTVRDKLRDVLVENMSYDECLSVLKMPLALVNVIGVPDLLRKDIAKFAVLTFNAMFPIEELIDELIELFGVKIPIQELLRSMSDPVHAVEVAYQYGDNVRTKVCELVAKSILVSAGIEDLAKLDPVVVTEIAGEIARALAAAAPEEQPEEDEKKKPGSCVGGMLKPTTPLAKLLRDPFKFVTWLRAASKKGNMDTTNREIAKITACMFMKALLQIFGLDEEDAKDSRADLYKEITKMLDEDGDNTLDGSDGHDDDADADGDGIEMVSKMNFGPLGLMQKAMKKVGGGMLNVMKKLLAPKFAKTVQKVGWDGSFASSPPA